MFFTYLYSPTYWGLRAAPERAALVPTTHDEPPLRFSVYREVFAAPRAFGFLTPAEEALVRGRFPLGERPAFLVGMGVEMPPAPDAASFRARHGLDRPYLLYAGRIDAGKGCAEMLAHHERYRREKAGAADLVLIGRLAMPLPDRPGVRYLGFLPEEEKAAAMAGAQRRRLPEPVREPLHRAARGARPRHPRPGQRALGRARGALPAVERRALLRRRRRVRRGGGRPRARPRLRAALGANGQAYVAAEYRWDVVLERWRALLGRPGKPR